MNANDEILEGDEELIECVLHELEPLAVRRDGAWAVAGPAGAEIVVKLEDGDAVVMATLAELTDASLEGRAAVAEFLLQAQPALRPATTGMNEEKAWVTARVSGEEMQVELACAFDAVFAACRAITPEAQALVNPDLAEAYLKLRRPHVSRA